MKSLRLAVCGLHLRGQPLNHQLTDLRATFVEACKTLPVYRLYALQEDSGVQKPCVIRPYQTAGCSSIEVEIWELPLENVGEFVAMIPPPLGIGTIGLDDGSVVKGFIAEAWVADAAKAGDHRVREITQHGGWLNYLESVV